jgi:hypothetical protein
MKNKSLGILLIVLSIAFLVLHAPAQSAIFTYQGRLTDTAAAANGTYQMQFSLYDALTGGTQQGTTIANSSVAVTNGVFTIQLDFSPATPFATGADRWIEIAVRKAADPPGFTTLTPRQQITSSPYAIKSVNADSALAATNAAQLGGVAANQYVLTGDTRLSDPRPPTAGSPDYIQNTTNAQSASTFNISGNGLIGGNLGVGTATPGADVDVFRTNLPASMRLKSTIFGDSTLTIDRATNSSNSALLRFYTAGSVDWSVGTVNGLLGGGNNNFYIYGAGSGNSVLSILTNGNVGIGTNASPYKLQVLGQSGIAVYGQSPSGSPVGVAGSAVAPSTNFGNAYIGSAGVWGTSTTSVGVFGTSDSNVGVAGVSSSNIGVLGRSSTGNAGYFDGTVVVASLGSAGSTSLCRNASNQISTCSSSLRYKTNIGSFSNGLDLIKRLRPITFDWKDGGMHDLGLGAEDVAKIDPLLVTYNTKGEVEGVKYDRVGVVLVNAVKEQQAQIERQQQEIEMLKKLVCADHPGAAVCKGH